VLCTCSVQQCASTMDGCDYTVLEESLVSLAFGWHCCSKPLMPILRTRDRKITTTETGNQKLRLFCMTSNQNFGYQVNRNFFRLSVSNHQLQRRGILTVYRKVWLTTTGQWQ
jgi:hypothetical protein